MKFINFFWLLFFLFWFSNHVFCQILIPYNKNGKWGFCDKKKNIIIPLEYDEVHSFREDSNLVTKKAIFSANVKSNGKWGIIDEKNQFIVPCQFENPLDWIREHGIYTVLSNQNENPKKNFFQLIDAQGKELLKLNGYVVCKGFDKNGISYVFINEKPDYTDTKVGVINTKGKILIPFVYDRMGYFNEHCHSEGLFGVCKNGKYGFVNEQNQVVIPFMFSCESADDYQNNNYCFENGKAKVYDGKDILIINKKGKVIEKQMYKSFGHEKYELLISRKKNNDLTTYTFVDKKTKKQLLADDFSFVYGEHNFFIISKNEKHGIVNDQLKFIYPMELSSNPTIHPIKDKESNKTINLWLITKNGKQGLIDSLGNQILPLEYDEIFDDLTPKKSTLAKKNGQYVLVDYQNKILKTYNFKQIENNYKHKNLITTTAEGLQGVISKTGEEIIPAKWKRVQIFGDISLVLDDNDRQTLVNEKGAFTDLFLDNHAYVGYYPLGEEYVQVTQQKKMGVLNKKGNLVVPCQYDNVDLIYMQDLKTNHSKNTFFMIKEDGLIGVRNLEKVIIAPKYSRIEQVEIKKGNEIHTFFLVKKDNKKGYVDLEGNEYFE